MIKITMNVTVQGQDDLDALVKSMKSINAQKNTSKEYADCKIVDIVNDYDAQDYRFVETRIDGDLVSIKIEDAYGVKVRRLKVDAADGKYWAAVTKHGLLTGIESMHHNGDDFEEYRAKTKEKLQKLGEKVCSGTVTNGVFEW